MKASKIFLVKPYKLPVSKPESKQNSTNKDISKEVKINTVQLKLPSDWKYMSNKGEIIKLDGNLFLILILSLISNKSIFNLGIYRKTFVVTLLMTKIP